MNNNLSDLDEDLPLFEHKDKIKKLITQAKKEALEEIGKTLVNKAMEKHNTSNPWDYKAILDINEIAKIIQSLINPSSKSEE